MALTRLERRQIVMATLGRDHLQTLREEWTRLGHRIVDKLESKEEAQRFLELDALIRAFIPARRFLIPWYPVVLWSVRRRARLHR